MFGDGPARNAYDDRDLVDSFPHARRGVLRDDFLRERRKVFSRDAFPRARREYSDLTVGDIFYDLPRSKQTGGESGF